MNRAGATGTASTAMAVLLSQPQQTFILVKHVALANLR